MSTMLLLVVFVVCKDDKVIQSSRPASWGILGPALCARDPSARKVESATLPTQRKPRGSCWTYGCADSLTRPELFFGNCVPTPCGYPAHSPLGRPTSPDEKRFRCSVPEAPILGRYSTFPQDDDRYWRGKIRVVHSRRSNESTVQMCTVVAVSAWETSHVLHRLAVLTFAWDRDSLRVQ